MWNVALGFFAGVIFSPQVRRVLRPAVREVVKAGLVVGSQIQQVAAEVKEDLEDIAAEAKAEVKSAGEDHSRLEEN
jgi:hypothetical protein